MKGNFSDSNHYVIAAETWLPWFNIREIDDGKVEYSGIMWEVRPADRKWGSLNPDGSWNGMVGMLHRNEADMALGPFAITQQREEACDFSTPLVVDEFSILMPAPNVQADPWILVKPFDVYTWLGLVLSLISVLLAFAWMDHYFGNPPKFGKLLSLILRMVFSEPPNWTPDQYSYQRVLTATILTSMFILAQSYSGTLVSMFAAPSFNVPIKSIEDLVAQSSLPWAIEAGTIMEDFTRSAAPGTTFRKLYDGTFEFTGLCSSNKDKIKAGEFAELCLILDIYSILSEDFTKTASCNFVFAHETFLPLNMGMAVQANRGSLLDRINFEVSSLLEAGLPMRWLENQQPNMTKCVSYSAVKESKLAERFPGLDFVEVQGLFLIICVLLGVATLIFIAEKVRFCDFKRVGNLPRMFRVQKCPFAPRTSTAWDDEDRKNTYILSNMKPSFDIPPRYG